MHPDATPEEVELGALATLKTPELVQQARGRGVDEAAFRVPAHQDVWRYLCERAEAGEPATAADVLAITGVALPEDLTDAENFVGTVALLGLQRKLRSVLLEGADALQDNPRAALTGLLGGLGKLATSETTEGHLRRFEVDARVRLATLESPHEAATGIPTGLPVFDQEEYFWQPGEVVSIIGATGTGKSFLMLRLAAGAYHYHGANVLFLSPESSVRDIELRLDPIIAHFLGIGLSNRKLRRGTEEATRYRAYMDALDAHVATSTARWVTRDAGSAGQFSPADIIAQAREHLSGGTPGTPDILCIDGFHLIRDDSGGKSWEHMQRAATLIKGLAQDLGILVLTVSQATRTVLQDVSEAPDLGQAAYGMGLTEAANRVISVAEQRGNPMRRVFKVPKHRDGQRVMKRLALHFDVDAGDIHQLGTQVQDDTGEVDF